MVAMAKKEYTAESIEVLSGLEPVKKRPGMYTDTQRPNHLAQEVIDNSVDEAISGFASKIIVILKKDGSLSVEDDGRGMPIDVHPIHKVPGVELILTRLHSGAKFSNKDYRFAGGLHGVGVSVVNALSLSLIVNIKRNGEIYEMEFADGDKKSKLKKIETLKNKKETGTKITFLPDPKYFDTPKFSITKLKQLLKAKAVLCSGLHITFTDEKDGSTEEWCYQDGLTDYLMEQLKGKEILPPTPFIGEMNGNNEAATWALAWTPDSGEVFQESYVNLIPTPMGGTHVNGLRTGILDAIRQFCEIRNLLPRGVKITSEDIWDNLNFVLSAKMLDAQFAGQTKEKLSSRQMAAFISGVVKDTFGLWLNQYVAKGTQIAEFIIENAQKRLKASKQVARKKVTSGPALPGKLSDCISQDKKTSEIFLVEGDSAGGSAKQARDKDFQAVMPLRGKILNTWEVDSSNVLSSQEVHDIAVAIGVDPGSDNFDGLRYGKICILADADSDGAHIATLLCALFVKHFRPLVEAGHIFVAMPPLYRIDLGKEVYYALDDDERQGIIDRIKSEKPNAKPSVQRFKGLGEMNPLQLRETTMARDTRRLVQLYIESNEDTNALMDMLLSKKRANDRKIWLESKGDLAEV